MKTNDFMQWLKTQPAAADIPIELGAINGNKEKFIALSPIPLGDVQAIGSSSSYNVMGVSLRVRYGKNFTTAQNKLQELQSLFEKTENADMNGQLVYFMVNEGQPAYNGKDIKGVFEFTLKIKIFYERK